MIGPPDPDMAGVLQVAFGRAVPARPVPLPPGYTGPGEGFALAGEGLPRQVMLLRYPAQRQNAAVRAFAALSALDRVGFPVPPVYYFGWTRRQASMLLLLRYVDGRGWGNHTHGFFARMGEHFAQMLAQLHLIDWNPLPDAALLPFGAAFEDLAGRVRQLQAPELHDILDWLTPRAARVKELPLTLLHGDYRLEHVIAEGTRVRAILGWERAVLGDPRLDVGYASAVLGAYGLTLSNQFLDAYLTAAGSLPALPFWEVFGALRLLARVATTLRMLSLDQRARLFEEVTPVWQGLLSFAARRAAGA